MAHIIKLAVLCEYESLVPLRDFLKGQNIEHMLRGVQTWALRVQKLGAMKNHQMLSRLSLGSTTFI